MKNRYIKCFVVAILVATNTVTNLSAQNSLSYSEFESKVVDYNHKIKQSQSQQEAMQSAIKLAKSAFVPAVDASGTYQYRINKSDLNFGTMAVPLENNTFSAEIGVLQPIYSGGAIRNNYKAAKIQAEISEKSVELTLDNIIFAAQSSYWGASAQKAMYETMCEYVEIIDKLNKNIKDKYDDGLIAKTDLIQMQSRLKEAQLQQSNSHLSYQLAIQNLNSLMGEEPLDEIDLTDSVFVKMPIPSYYTVSEILDCRPDYIISRLGVDYQKKQIDIADSSYRPTLAIGFKESWGTQMINIDGTTLFNSNLFASLKIPIFHGGARRHKQSMQKAILNVKESQMREMEDQISKEAASSWTELNESIKQVDIAIENCNLAEESLELNTFSYKEGKLQILDVLSAQLNWIQAYTNLIQTYYKQHISNASYSKSIGVL